MAEPPAPDGPAADDLDEAIDGDEDLDTAFGMEPPPPSIAPSSPRATACWIVTALIVTAPAATRNAEYWSSPSMILFNPFTTSEDPVSRLIAGNAPVSTIVPLSVIV